MALNFLYGSKISDIDLKTYMSNMFKNLYRLFLFYNFKILLYSAEVFKTLTAFLISGLLLR
jgi:hypothetical protein